MWGFLICETLERDRFAFSLVGLFLRTHARTVNWTRDERRLRVFHRWSLAELPLRMAARPLPKWLNATAGFWRGGIIAVSRIL